MNLQPRQSEPVRSWEIQLNRLPDGAGIEALLMDERHPMKIFEPEIDVAAALNNVINELEMRDLAEFAQATAPCCLADPLGGCSRPDSDGCKRPKEAA